MEKISIILLTWNAEYYFKNCLNSVLESSKELNREILIIDNGSTDTTVQLIQSYLPSDEIIFIANKNNEGVAKARNIGLKHAKGEYIWFLDIDTVVNPESVYAMIDYMNNHPDCGICGCKLINSAGEVQDSCRKYPSFRYKLNNVLSSFLAKLPFTNTLKNNIDNENQSQFYRKEMLSLTPFGVEYIIGACQLIRKEVVDQVGYLDEHIFYGPEDADFCLRAHQKGWKVVYLPQVSFIHEYQQITNKRLFSRMSLLHTRALFYFFRKHKL